VLEQVVIGAIDHGHADRRVRKRARGEQPAETTTEHDDMRLHADIIAVRMDLSEAIAPGMTGRSELVVGEEHTAPRVGSGLVHVLATPVMINLFEAAALDAVDQYLPPGYQSLGTVLNVRHIAATPVGMRVTASAEVVGVEGRAVRFRVEAHDERELIGDGTHERVVVNVAKFDQRVQRKLG